MMTTRWMRVLPRLVVGSVLSWSTACVLDRPAGSYATEGGSDDTSPLIVSDAGSDAPNTIVARNDASKVEPGDDGAVTAAPLAVLDGHRYLMRIDTYSTASLPTPAGGVNLAVQLSNLFLVDFNLQADGSLVASETYCSRHYTTKCTKGCPSIDSWHTKLYPTVPAKFTRHVQRGYQLDAQGQLVAGAGAPHALGFDPDPSNVAVAPNQTTTPPTMTSDAWSVGTAQNYSLYGMANEIDTQVNTTVFGNPVSVTCYLMSTELLDFTFRGQFDATDANSLESLAGASPFRADMSGWNVHSLDVAGDPTYCMSDTPDKATSTDAINAVRFKIADDAAGCPDGSDLAAAYEAVFPGDATAPTTFR